MERDNAYASCLVRVLPNVCTIQYVTAEFRVSSCTWEEKRKTLQVYIASAAEYILVESPGNKIDINCMPPET